MAATRQIKILHEKRWTYPHGIVGARLGAPSLTVAHFEVAVQPWHRVPLSLRERACAECALGQWNKGHSGQQLVLATDAAQRSQNHSLPCFPSYRGTYLVEIAPSIGTGRLSRHKARIVPMP